MRNPFKVVVPCLALATVMAACEDKEDPIGPGTQTANVRFVNAITGANGNILLTANGSVVGTPRAFGDFTTQCAVVPSGNINLAFGTANTGGTAIASSLGTATQNLAANGNFTVLAAGTAANPQLFLLNNTATSPPTGQAAIRFVSVVPGTNSFDVFATAPNATLTTPTTANLAFGVNGTSFVNVPAGTTQLTFRNAGTSTVAFAPTATMTLGAGDVRTVLLAPTSTGTGFQTITLSGC